MRVLIGDNVVVGAGSLVTKDCKSDSVYAGVPARKLMSINEFFDKRYAKQKAEAKELAQRYYERFKRRPGPEVFHEYFMLFETKSSVLKNNVFSNKLKLGNTEKQSIEYMEEHAPEFSNYEEFMRYCFDDQLKAIKLIKGKITDLDRMKIEEQKKAVRSGYDMEIIPSDLATYGGEAKKILDDLQSRNERMFLVTVLFLNARSREEK